MCFWLVYQPSDFSHMDFLENGLRFIRRGRASRPKRDLDGDEPSDYEELSSEVEMDDMKEWLCITASKNQLLPHQILVKKFLPPGTVMDLYEQYKATQCMLGSACVSLLGFGC